MAEARAKWTWKAVFGNGDGQGFTIGGDSKVPASYGKDDVKRAVEADSRKRYPEVAGLRLATFAAHKHG